MRSKMIKSIDDRLQAIQNKAIDVLITTLFDLYSFATERSLAFAICGILLVTHPYLGIIAILATKFMMAEAEQIIHNPPETLLFTQESAEDEIQTTGNCQDWDEN